MGQTASIAGLAKAQCVTHIRHMFNLLSFLFGIVSLVVVIPATIPLLGWANWIALPILAIGIVLGQFSSSKGGRNFCLIVLIIAAIRLSLGGGII